MKLIRNVIIRGQIEVITGMHIGGSVDDMEIGGMDDPVIKNPINEEPYVPGSSLKGKMRSQMEKTEGKIFDRGEPCGCKRCMVCRVFGPHRSPNHDLGPTRIIVRDANLSEESRQVMYEAAKSGKSYYEIKTENVINRKTGTSVNFSEHERVPPGAKFDLEIVVQIFDMDKEHDVLGFVKKALKSVEESYLGGSGSRGYGKIKFINLKMDTEPFEL